MENHIQQFQSPIQEQQKRSHPVRNLIGACGVALALMNTVPSTEVAEAYHSKDDAATADYSLPKPSSLHGYDAPLSPETRRQGREATVEIRFRYAGSSPEQEWSKGCTGVKTIVGGQVRISTASHCFENLTGEKFGILKSEPGQPKAANYISRANDLVEYGVFDPQVHPSERKFKPLAKIDGISIANGQDWSLLSVAPLDTPTSSVPRTFDQIPSLKLADNQAEAPARPARGQRVSLFGVFSANGERQSTSLGRYLGRIKQTNEDGGIRYTDIVGLKPKTIAEDTCLPGSSGSSFTTTSKGGLTYMSGPLSGVTNETWVPALVNNQQGDEKPGDVSNEIENAQYWRGEYQRLLKVDTTSFSTICRFTTNLPGSVSTLNAGFSVEATIPPRPEAPPVGFESGKGGSAESMK